MVAENYEVVSAEVLRRTARVACIKPHAGELRAGEEIVVPITVFEMAEEVEEGDDEVVVARWFCEKEKLI